MYHILPTANVSSIRVRADICILSRNRTHIAMWHGTWHDNWPVASGAEVVTRYKMLHKAFSYISTDTAARRVCRCWRDVTEKYTYIYTNTMEERHRYSTMQTVPLILGAFHCESQREIQSVLHSFYIKYAECLPTRSMHRVSINVVP
jgi:hypothetical protein